MKLQNALFFCIAVSFFGSLHGASQDFISQGPTPLNGPIYTPLTPHLPSASVNQNGAIQALAVNPSNSNNLYIGAASGGVWSTSNFGASWTPLLDHQEQREEVLNDSNATQLEGCFQTLLLLQTDVYCSQFPNREFFVK